MAALDMERLPCDRVVFHAVEIRLRSTGNALLAPTKAAPRGTALHMQSFIVAPTRPGLVLRAASDR